MNTIKNKRVKDALITIGSMIVSSFALVVMTPQWSDFTTWANDAFTSNLLGFGFPMAVIAVLGAVIAGVWKMVLNHYILKGAGYSDPGIARASGAKVDLY